MQKKIEADDIYFAEFHKKASEICYVPSLQRPYTWDVKEVEKLWSDILDNESPYYIGSLVIISGTGTVDRDQIIDGQQRLTTLALMLVAIRDYISGKKAKGFAGIIADIEDMLIKYRKEDRQIRLKFSNENANVVYSAIVDEKSLDEFDTEGQRRFTKNLTYIKDQIKKYSPGCKPKDISVLFDRIKNLQLISIRCLDKSAAYKLFESINATGISLATTDLIKTSIFEALHTRPDDLKFAEEGWNSMYEVFGEDTAYLKDYIRHHWIATIGYTSHARLLEAFTKKYDTAEKTLNYARSLYDSANIYIALREGNVESLGALPTKKRFEISEIKEQLKFLSFLGVDQIYSVLLYCYGKQSNHFKKDLTRFIAFQFLYKYVPGSPSVPEKKYFADFCIQKISRPDMFKGLAALCKNNELQFTEAILERLRYVEGRSGDTQFILEKYLYYKGGGAKFAKPTIEHIIPQDVTSETAALFRVDPKKARKKIHEFGNLTVLESEDNSSSSQFNRPYSEKKTAYQKNIFTGNTLIPNYPFDSDPELAIRRRGEDLARDIYQIFVSALEEGKWLTEKEVLARKK